MSKNHYKRHKNVSVTSKYFGENGILQNFVNYFTFFNKSELNYCWIFISDNFNKFLIFNGKFNFQIFFGSVKINGVEFCAPFFEKIYSPMYFPKITIEKGKNSKKDSKSIEECLKKLCKLGIFSESEENVLSFLKYLKNDINFNDKWSVLRVSTMECVVSEDLSQFKEFNRLFEVNSDFSFAKNLKFSFSEEDSPSYVTTAEISDCVENIITTLSTKKDVSVVACGSKDSGKSTLMRMIINRFFAEGCKEVFVIDGDPGQSEFTPNGCLTLTKILGPLFGPPFTHQYSSNIKIIKQFFLGLLSPAEDPKIYCRIFEILYHYYLSVNNENITPLIINTMGWLKGIGMSLLTFKVLLINPTYVIQLKKGNSEIEFGNINLSSLNKLNINCDLIKTLSSFIYILKSPVMMSQQHKFHLKPIQHRDLTIVAYLFHQTIDRPLCFPIDSLPTDYKHNPVTRLRCRIPYFLHYCLDENINIEKNFNNIVRLKLVYSEIDKKELCDKIDQCFSLQLVAICRTYIKPTFESILSTDVDMCSEGIDSMYCIGMGIVSHVREETCEIDLLTGVDITLLNGSYLVKGKVSCPNCLFFNQD